MFNEQHKKESPILSLLGMGGGIGGGLVQGGVSPVSASGGDIDGQPGGNGYKYHVFTQNGNFVVSNAAGNAIEILLVAGGGGGGSRNNNGSDGGGGGGAGGVIHVPGYTAFADGTYPIVVGNGGTGAPESPGGPVPSAAVGGDTIFKLSGPNAHITAKGGGGGGSGPSGGPMTSNGPGGSGGGGGGGGGPGQGSHFGSAVTQPVTLLPSPNYTAYGNNGGTGDGTNPHVGASGGGAGAVGTPADQPNATVGGAGQAFAAFAGNLPAFGPMPSAWKTAVAPQGYFGGGGAGGAGGPGSTNGANGGVGGGGGSVPSTNDPLTGSAAVDATGGGGSGGSGVSGGSGGNGGVGSDGGNGIVIIRYAE